MYCQIFDNKNDYDTHYKPKVHFDGIYEKTVN
jgi:hypothetical protein